MPSGGKSFPACVNLLQQPLLPVGLEIQRRGDVEIPSPPGHQQRLSQLGHAIDRFAEVAQEDDVGVDVAEELVRRAIHGDLE